MQVSMVSASILFHITTVGLYATQTVPLSPQDLGYIWSHYYFVLCPGNCRAQTFPICKPINKCQSVSDRLWQIMQFHFLKPKHHPLSQTVLRCRRTLLCDWLSCWHFVPNRLTEMSRAVTGNFRRSGCVSHLVTLHTKLHQDHVPSPDSYKLCLCRNSTSHTRSLNEVVPFPGSCVTLTPPHRYATSYIWLFCDFCCIS